MCQAVEYGFGVILRSLLISMLKTRRLRFRDEGLVVGHTDRQSQYVDTPDQSVLVLLGQASLCVVRLPRDCLTLVCPRPQAQDVLTELRQTFSRESVRLCPPFFANLWEP